MKYLVALTLAVLLVVLPLAAAQASTIYLDVTPTPMDVEGHHINVKLNMAGGGIPPDDLLSWEASAMTGYFDEYATANWGGSGIYVTGTGIWAYVYQSTINPFGVYCPNPGIPWFKDYAGKTHGCIQLIVNLTLGHDQQVMVENDWYPYPYNKWIYWVRDELGNFNDIAEFSTTVDWFTGVDFTTAVVYTTGFNPLYVMDAEWLHPMTWNGTWTPFTSAFAGWRYTSPLDALMCNKQYSIIKSFDPHEWTAGSTFDYINHAVCSGYIWTS